MPMKQTTGITIEPDTINTSVLPEDEDPRDLRSILYSMFISIEGTSWQDKLDTLAMCDCCERHQINKPTTMISWVDTPTNDCQNNECNCYCRHTSRFICRQFVTINGGCVPCAYP